MYILFNQDLLAGKRNAIELLVGCIHFGLYRIMINLSHKV